jgi:hypothetical protein
VSTKNARFRQLEKFVAPKNTITLFQKLTFFSLSINLVIATMEDPVRSFRAVMASLMSSIVDISVMSVCAEV